MVWEMPSLTARTCGICPVSHLLASAKAGDECSMGVTPPPTGLMLRRSPTSASSPRATRSASSTSARRTCCSGWDADREAQRVRDDGDQNPDLARAASGCGSSDRRSSRRSAGRRCTPAGPSPVGSPPAVAAGKAVIRAGLPGGRSRPRSAALDCQATRSTSDQRRDRHASADFPSLFLGLANADGTWEHHGGKLR